MTAEERFNALRDKWEAAQLQLEQLRRELVGKYGEWNYAKNSELKRVEQLRARANKASDRLMEHIFTHASREWRAGVPTYWIVRELKWADVITTGPLSVVPPPAFGYTERDMVRFAGKVSAA